MALRLVETVLPKDKGNKIPEIVEDKGSLGVWLDEITGGQVEVQILVSVEKSEQIMDVLHKHFSTVEGFRVIVIPVVASLPREEPEKEEPTKEKADDKSPMRVSREELYQQINDSTKVTRIFVATVILSSIVAALGLLQNNLAVIIGAMVIAPLLGPNVALALATTLGDIPLAKRALKANLVGIAIAFAFAVLMGAILNVDPQNSEIASRTQVGFGDVVLALAAGCAGALAFTAGLSSTVVGVMVAVALMPPLITFGMLLSAREWVMARGALMVLLVNVISVNLAGVLTFLLQGVHPVSWWDKERARKATRFAIGIWILLLAILIALILLFGKA